MRRGRVVVSGNLQSRSASAINKILSLEYKLIRERG
jgi:hypothetical protein